MLNKSDDTLLQHRQQLIITSAKACFSHSGFYGASMADISRESGLSAGQIYRYFPSKDVIVSKTINSIAQEWHRFLLKNLPLQHSAMDIIDINSAFWKQWPQSGRRLLLEMYSEATRNADVREVLASEEAILLTRLESIFSIRWPHLSFQQCRNRIQTILLLVDGVACRIFEESELDQSELHHLNKTLDMQLFS